MKRYTEYKDSGVEWIGEIPGHWKMILNGRLFHEEIRKPFQNDIPLSLSQKDGLIPSDDLQIQTLKTSSYENWKRVLKNDLVLNRFKAHLGVLFASNYIGMVSFHYGVYESKISLHPCYYEYLFHTNEYKQIYAYSSKGMTVGLQNLSNRDFYAVKSIYPPLPEQQAIVSYLDSKVSKIDEFISIAEKKISALEELKQTIIAEAVTKGINKNVTMKDSGVFWQPQIPKSWSVTHLKHILFKKKREKPINAEILICSNKGTVFKRGDSKMGLVSDDESIYQGVKRGDLLIHGMDTWHGAIAISNYDGMCTPVVHVCDSVQNKAYIAYYLRNMASAKVFKLISNGVRQNTSDFRSWDKMGSVAICLPPIEEQKAIVSYIDNKAAKIDQLCQAEQSQIDMLKEYKQRLISDVVTGKVKVIND